MILPMTLSSAQLLEVSPRSGKMSQNEPPPNSTISSTPSTKPGTAWPARTATVLTKSNLVPFRTAFRTPSGTDTR